MFTEIQKSVQDRLKEMSEDTLFFVEPDRDKIWEIYLSAFDDEHRQGNNCNCCKSFLRQFSGIVSLRSGQKETLWDFEVKDEEYKKPIQAVKKYIHSLPVVGVFYSDNAKCGTVRNRDGKRDMYWDHFGVTLPNKFVKSDAGPLRAAALDNKNVLERSLNEITDDAVDTVLELIDQNSLYRGQEFKGMLTEFQKIRKKHKNLKQFQKEAFYWQESTKVSQAVTRIRNSAIGTLLNDLSEGRDLDSAVTAFERVVAPTNYKRPSTLATPKMIEAAKKRLEELGLIGSLKRRVLSTRDLNINNALYVHRASNSEKDIFDVIKADTVINPKSLTKVEEISIKDFVDKVLPKSKSVRVFLENNQLNNFVSLVGPQNSGDPTMFKWNNNYSWSYSGQVANSIKERVKQAGGNVSGVLRVSLSWNNQDDLDLHIVEPGGYRINYPNKRIKSPSGGILDLDANGGDGIRVDPAENVYWLNYPTVGGIYEVIVNQFSKRQNNDSGFEVEIEFDGETYNFAVPSNGMTGHNHKIVKFHYTKKDGFSIIQESAKSGGNGKYVSKEKWGLKTGQFHKVKAITLSPNFWNSEMGDKQYIFLLDKCVSDEKIRGFYNEFLKEDLLKDRKVFEMLGSKVEIETTEDELSGLGFSETSRASLLVEVEGQFKRNLKINF